MSNFKFQIQQRVKGKGLRVKRPIYPKNTFPFPLHALPFQKGFTLIELLIVVAIIGILSALLMTNFIGIRQRARDAQRKSDIRQIQSALELYRADNGGYPNSAALYVSACPTPSVFAQSGTTYMQQVPCDPLGLTYYNAGKYYYVQGNGGATYTLATCLENTADTDVDGTFVGDNTCTSGKYYVKKNP